MKIARCLFLLSLFILIGYGYTVNATTIEVIYSETLKQVQIPVPPIPEQLNILTFLQNITSVLAVC